MVARWMSCAACSGSVAVCECVGWMMEGVSVRSAQLRSAQLATRRSLACCLLCRDCAVCLCSCCVASACRGELCLRLPRVCWLAYRSLHCHTDGSSELGHTDLQGSDLFKTVRATSMGRLQCAVSSLSNSIVESGGFVPPQSHTQRRQKVACFVLSSRRTMVGSPALSEVWS